MRLHNPHRSSRQLRSAPVTSAAEPMVIPSVSFDGTHEDWNVVRCRIEKIGLKGVILSNQSKTGLLPWKRIRAISVSSMKACFAERKRTCHRFSRSTSKQSKKNCLSNPWR